MEELKFYNLKKKKAFKSSKYTIQIRNGRRFAVAEDGGTKWWRVLGKK